MKPVTALIVATSAVSLCASPGCMNPASTGRLSRAQVFESADAVIHISGVS